MIQGGDPAGTGMGGPGYKFEDETKGFGASLRQAGQAGHGQRRAEHERLYNSSSRRQTTEWLTGKHTIFGEVVEGQDIADEEISRLPRGAQDKPKTPVVLESVTIERVA